MNIKNLRSQLLVNDFLVAVHLGCTAAERKISQSVTFSLEVNFDEMPPGCDTDRLEDTLCYAVVCEQIQTTAQTGEYQLVESLASQVLTSLLPLLPQNTEIKLTTHKLRPPIDDLNGGVQFVLSCLTT
ncbi:MAG: dihydroneopterin aldolase [Candidatus Azotimanducaceae bacterium]|jgi:dihydroneopterin aldolase